MSVKIVLHDFLNYSIDGLTDLQLRKIQNATGISVKGAFMQAAFKAGIWDGKSSFINDDGVGLVRNLPDVLDALENIRDIDLDSVDFEDLRELKQLELPEIDSEWLKDEVGYSLYDYQEKAINSVLRLTHDMSCEGGIIKLATNSGKSVTALGISKAFDGHLKTLVIVPSTNLVTQTFRDYQKADIASAMILSKMSEKQRVETVRKFDHIIVTSSLFLNIHEHFKEEEWVLIYDEVHLFGDKMILAIRESLAHCQYRVGLTATMPAEKKDFYKDALIRHHFGDDLVSVTQSELINRGISSNINIDCITVSTPIDVMSHTEKGWDWDKEVFYYDNNAIRFEAIMEQVKLESGGNTLILCQPALGEVLAEHMEIGFVNEATHSDLRQEWYDTFAKSTEYSLAATFGCASTGLSINNIQTLILIEIGADRTRIMQSIGRGLRLDGDKNHIRVVDISSDTKYARRHRKERERIYVEEGFEYKLLRTCEAE